MSNYSSQSNSNHSKWYENTILLSLVIIAIFLILAIVTPLFIEFTIFRNSMYSPVSNGEWAGFLGSFLGGIIGGCGTLIAVLISVKTTKEVQKKQIDFQKGLLQLSIKPILTLNHNKYTNITSNNDESFYISEELGPNSSTSIKIINVGEGNLVNCICSVDNDYISISNKAFSLKKDDPYNLSLHNINKQITYDCLITFFYKDILGYEYKSVLKINHSNNVLKIFNIEQTLY